MEQKKNTKIKYWILILSAFVLTALVLGAVLLHQNKERVSAESSRNLDDSDSNGPDASDRVNESESAEESGETARQTEEFIPLEPKEEDGVVGLRKYFRGKLIIDMEKVHLYLNVRKEANDESTILAVLWPADIVRYDGRQGDWYRVVMDGYYGFVHADYVLTDDEAFYNRIHSVGYAAMIKENHTELYSKANDFKSGVKKAAKGETFRIIGVTTECYKLQVNYEGYDLLYCKQTDVIPYYLFLAPGNTSGMSEWEEESMATMEISENLERTEKLQAEAELERAAYESQLAEYIAASKAEEASRLEAAYRKSSIEAARKATEWQQYIETVAGNETADEAGRRYIGTFRVTFYCHCQICCGVWGNNDPNYTAHGSSGITLSDNATVAVNPAQIPFGTRLMVVRKDGAGNIISEREYLAADEGVPSYAIDVYRRLHSDALAGGMYYAEVYVIE